MSTDDVTTTDDKSPSSVFFDTPEKIAARQAYQLELAAEQAERDELRAAVVEAVEAARKLVTGG